MRPPVLGVAPWDPPAMGGGPWGVEERCRPRGPLPNIPPRGILWGATGDPQPSPGWIWGGGTLGVPSSAGSPPPEGSPVGFLVEGSPIAEVGDVPRAALRRFLWILRLNRRRQPGKRPKWRGVSPPPKGVSPPQRGSRLSSCSSSSACQPLSPAMSRARPIWLC